VAAYVAALVLAGGIGVILGMLGGGGAILTVPVLVSVLGEDVRSATTMSLVVVMAAAAAAGARQAAAGAVCWRVALVFAAAAVPGSVVGTLANGAVPETVLLGLFAALMLVVAALTWRGRPSRAHGDAPVEACPRLRPAPLAGTGAAVGGLTAFFGVGGGFVIVPALHLAMGIPIRRAIGTSLVIVAMVSGVSLAGHLLNGNEVDWAVALPFAAVTVAGAFAGVELGRRVSPARLTRAFAVLLAAVAVFVLATLG
jgi:hypothetical protein